MFGRKKKGDLTAKNIEAGGDVTIQNKGGEGDIQAKDIRAGKNVFIVKGTLTYIEQRTPDTPPISLDEALSTLAAMPVNEDAPIPEVTTLPVGSQMPFAPYRYFVGREPELRQLAEILKAEQGGAAIGQLVATTGLGGIGKTQLAVEFAHRYGPYFAGGLFWLDFSNAGGINNEVARCGGIDGMNLLDGFENLPLPDQVRLVQRAWREPLPRLLIFDNCEDEALVEEWRPKTGGCRVLITSRRGEWDVALAISQVRLDTLTPAESVRLLGHLAPRLSTEEKMAVAEALGHFPLALHLAGSFLKRYKRVEASRYLEEVEKKTLQHPSLEGRGSRHSPTQHELHVARTFAVSWERLDKSDSIDQLAQQMFLRAAYFAPGVPIPPDLLVATLSRGALTLAEQDTSPPTLTEYDYEDAQYRLLELGLLEEEPTGFVIHRLLAAFAHLQPISQPQQAVEQALVDEAYRLNKTGYPAPLRTWQAHLRHVTDVAQLREDILAGILCHTLGHHFNMVANHEKAWLYYERAFAINQKVLGTEHPDTITSLNNLGTLLHEMGQYEKARVYYEHVYAIREKVLGPMHPHTTSTLNNLGRLWQAMGQYERALPYVERAVAIKEKILGPEHSLTAVCLNNLGQLWQAMGQYERALPYHERALAIQEKVLGAEHPCTATSLNDLGYLWQAMGQYERARPYYERALVIREKVLGTEHPDTAASLNNLGYLWQTMGEYEKACLYYERAFAIREKALGAEHPDTAASLNNLGFLWEVMGKYERAHPYLERALAIRKKVLGAEHLDTAQSLNNLGFLWKAMGEYERAHPYYERALAIYEKVLGSEHPDTATTINNLGNLWQAQGQYESARPYYECALAIYEKMLGFEHPNTATSLNNLGQLWIAMEKYEKARPYLERALAIRKKVLGVEHFDTAQSLNNLGALLRLMGEYESARPYYERALAICEKVLGELHPNTAIVMGNLGRVLAYLGYQAEGRAHIEQAVAILEKRLGGDHPTTQKVLGYLREVETNERE